MFIVVIRTHDRFIRAAYGPFETEAEAERFSTAAVLSYLDLDSNIYPFVAQLETPRGVLADKDEVVSS